MKNEVLIPRDTSIVEPNIENRKEILDFQTFLQNIDHPDFFILNDRESTQLCPLKHTFSDGIYVRDITIPA